MYVTIYVASNNYCCKVKQVLYDVLPYKNQLQYKDCTHVQFLESHMRKYSTYKLEAETKVTKRFRNPRA